MSFGEEQDEPLIEGNFRLNKILHMCQIFRCVKYKKPLFKELMIAFLDTEQSFTRSFPTSMSYIILSKDLLFI